MKLPPKWGEDHLSSFITSALKNALATFVRKPEQYALISQIDGHYHSIAENLNNPSDFLGAMLLLRSHSAFRGAASLGLSGQIPDAFPLLRASLEYALYAFHINRNPGLGEQWIKRHDDATSLRAAKKAFRHVTVMETLRTHHNMLCPTIYRDALRAHDRFWGPS
jgi:hypothetical protein